MYNWLAGKKYVCEAIVQKPELPPCLISRNVSYQQRPQQGKNVNKSSQIGNNYATYTKRALTRTSLLWITDGLLQEPHCTSTVNTLWVSIGTLWYSEKTLRVFLSTKNRKHQQFRCFVTCSTHLQQSKIPNLQIGEEQVAKRAANGENQ